MVWTVEEIQKRRNQTMTDSERWNFMQDLIDTVIAQDAAIKALTRLATGNAAGGR